MYLYADTASREVLNSDQQKVVLIGGDFGYGNFGDLLQHTNSLNAAKQAKRFATVSIMAANAIGFAEFSAFTKKNYGSDAIVFVADHPLILRDSSPQLELITEMRNLAAIHLYGGGFLNNRWGDYVLGIVEHFLNLVPDAIYVVSGQQITTPYQSRVLEHIKEFKPKLFGVRDELSQLWLREGGFNPHFSFDDATEALLNLTQTLPLRLGAGLLLHLNSSDYTSNDDMKQGISQDMQKLKASHCENDVITLFQAFRDSRDDVCDARETLKKLDIAFPFHDLRHIDLAALAYSHVKAPLTHPIAGEFGYSCSYHVTLWLQLAGIPCWLKSSNPYYDQKSESLQVTQSLEQFISAPKLADHRYNLERRAEWNERLQTTLRELPDVNNHLKFINDFNSIAPWSFFYKGERTAKEQLSEARISDQLQRERADLAKTQIEELYGRIEALTAQLTAVGNEAHEQRERANLAEGQLSGGLGAMRRCIRIIRHIFRGEMIPIRNGLRRLFKRT
jgi:uncharacterized protein YbjT (DUF2867 family)